MLRAPGCSCLVACALVSMEAGARDPPALTLGVDFEAPASCPGVITFQTQVTARVPVSLAGTPDGDATVRVRIERRGEAFAGTAMVTGAGNATTESASAPTCDEVVAALALFTAYNLELRRDSVPPVPHAEPPPDSQPLPVPEAQPVAPARRFASLEVELGVRSGAGPRISPDMLAGVARVGPGSVWGAAVGLTRGGELRGAWGEARFRLAIVRLDACPIAVGSAGRLALRPCAILEGGARFVESSGPLAAELPPRPWIAPGVGTRVGLAFGRRLALGVHAGVLFPLVRDDYLTRADELAWKTPTVAGRAALVLGVAFPRRPEVR